MDEFKQRQRAVWASGDYAPLSELISDVGERVVEAAGVDESMEVLDVACGSGNVALPAAKTGARVVALDLVPELLEAGRRKADSAGVEIEWVAGDAEELPFEDDSFDRVFSTFGHMFAPRHRRTADEMLRVCRPGGAIAICCWTPEGSAGAILRAGAPYQPPPPDYASPPILWGTEEHVREMFGAAATGFDFERHTTTIEWESPESFLEYFADRFGPLVTAKAMLGERWEDMRRDVLQVFEERNESPDGRFVLQQEYLMSVVRL